MHFCLLLASIFLASPLKALNRLVFLEGEESPCALGAQDPIQEDAKKCYQELKSILDKIVQHHPTNRRVQALLDPSVLLLENFSEQDSIAFLEDALPYPVVLGDLFRFNIQRLMASVSAIYPLQHALQNPENNFLYVVWEALVFPVQEGWLELTIEEVPCIDSLCVSLRNWLWFFSFEWARWGRFFGSELRSFYEAIGST